MKDLLSQIENLNVSKMSPGSSTSRKSRETISQEEFDIIHESQRMFMSEHCQEVQEEEASSNKRSLQLSSSNILMQNDEESPQSMQILMPNRQEEMRESKDLPSAAT